MTNNKKQTKTLFNSSESSNFILNMTEEQYSKLASFGLMTACFFVSVSTAFCEIQHQIAKKTSYLIAAGGLAAAGVFCMILALIAIIKKYISKKAIVPVCAFAAMLVWSVISLIDSYDTSVSLYGFPQRSEGVLATLFYISFFITALSVKRETALRALLDGIVLSGLLNAVWGVIQVFTGKLGRYAYISLKLKVNAASGLAQSPLFLAMLLSLSLTAAIIGAVSAESRRRRIFCLVSAAVFSFTMIFTYSLIGICGLVFAVIAAVLSVFITKSSKKRMLSVLTVIIPAVIAVLIVDLGAVGNISSYRLYDGRELWWADSHMRIYASSSVNSDILDLDSTLDVYLYMNDKTIDMIGRSPLTGTGPEQLAYPQIRTFGVLSPDSDISDIILQNRNIFDKCYNEYLYIAATRGIPALIALAALIVSVLFIGYKKMKEEHDTERTSLFFITLCGALIFLIGCSSIAFAPLFWAAAGASCASCTGAEIPEKKKKK